MSGHVFIATSLDGFIARSNGALDWLFAASTEGEDHGYETFLARMDGIVMGRGTYEVVRGFDPWPYAKPVVVLSRSLKDDDVPAQIRGRVRITDKSPPLVFDELSAEGWQRAYIDGGAVIRSFLAEGLVAELIITRVPVLIGDGLPLFGKTSSDRSLIHENTEAFASGLVQSRYTLNQSS